MLAKVCENGFHNFSGATDLTANVSVEHNRHNVARGMCFTIINSDLEIP